MNNEKVKKIDNNGFSLVELIIVIAIMAVLIGVLAPQYLKYVEKSRVSTDVSNAQEIASAISVALAEGQDLASGDLSTFKTTVTNLDTDVKTKSTKGAGKGQTFYVTIEDKKGVTGVYAYKSTEGGTPAEANKLYPSVGSAYSSYITD
jgi:prepilin-type N-terminal cleavage/methylation domain-containing protein